MPMGFDAHDYKRIRTLRAPQRGEGTLKYNGTWRNYSYNVLLNYGKFMLGVGWNLYSIWSFKNGKLKLVGGWSAGFNTANSRLTSNEIRMSMRFKRHNSIANAIVKVYKKR